MYLAVIEEFSQNNFILKKTDHMNTFFGILSLLILVNIVLLLLSVNNSVTKNKILVGFKRLKVLYRYTNTLKQ